MRGKRIEMSNKESVMGTGEKQRMAFRTAVRGYAKEDVNRYIGKMDASFRGIEQTLKNTITAQQKTIEQQTEEKEALLALQAQQQMERDALLQTLEQCRLSLSERYAECETLRAENQALRDVPHDLASPQTQDAQFWRQKALQLEELLAVQNRKEEAAISALREKAEQYDMVSKGVGKWITDANEKADAILQDARRRAQEIHAQALQQSEAARCEAERTLQKMKREFAQSLGAPCEKACADAIEKLTVLQNRLRHLTQPQSEITVPLGEETAQTLPPEEFSEKQP